MQIWTVRKTKNGPSWVKHRADYPENIWTQKIPFAQIITTFMWRYKGFFLIVFGRDEKAHLETLGNECFESRTGEPSPATQLVTSIIRQLTELGYFDEREEIPVATVVGEDSPLKPLEQRIQRFAIQFGKP